MLINKIMKCIYLATSAATAVATSVAPQKEERQEGNNTFWIRNQKKEANDEKFIRDKKR